MEIGKNLKRKRIERKLTHQDLAILSGVTQSSISDIERDVRSPTLNTLEKLCLALQASPLEILPYSQYSELSKEEHDLLDLLRKLSDEEKTHLLSLFENLLKDR